MANKQSSPYRTDEAQRLLDAAEKAFEKAGDMMVRNPHQACNHFKRAVEQLDAYATMVNDARIKDGLTELSDEQILSHFEKETKMADMLKVKETIERGMARECKTSRPGNRAHL